MQTILHKNGNLIEVSYPLTGGQVFRGNEIYEGKILNVYNVHY